MAQPPNWGAINWIILKLYSWFGHFQDYRMLKTTATKSVWIRVHVVKISVWYQWIKVNVNMKSNLLKPEHYLFTPQLGTSWPSLAHFFYHSCVISVQLITRSAVGMWSFTPSHWLFKNLSISHLGEVGSGISVSKSNTVSIKFENAKM